MSPSHRSHDPLHRAVFLTGPTASGKTAVGVHLARQLQAEVIALDSMTLYRGMDIGTAKPTPAERGGVPHHLIDVLDPWESASVAAYRGWALQAAREIEQRGRRVILVGGTPLYLKAMLRGLFEGPAACPSLRSELEAEAEQHGDGALHARLTAIDSVSAARIHPNDRRRIVRALEVAQLTGRPLSAWQTEHERPAEGVIVLALHRPRAVLHDRINRRVIEMFEQGLVAEVERLQEGPRPIGPVAAQGVGYREVIDMLAGELTRDQAIERTQARTRQFAKRQETWFRGLAEVTPCHAADDEPAEVVANRLASWISRMEEAMRTNS